MELFERAKVVRLRSHHGKYLTAEEDEERVTQSRDGSAPGARWEVEFADGGRTLRFRSCYGRYLAATGEHFLLGWTGKKVMQDYPGAAARLDSSLEWEPLREGFQVKLKSGAGHFLRANGRIPPWRNSVTHDLPNRTATQDWVLWDVDIMQVRIQPAAAVPAPPAKNPLSAVPAPPPVAEPPPRPPPPSSQPPKRPPPVADEPPPRPPPPSSEPPKRPPPQRPLTHSSTETSSPSDPPDPDETCSSHSDDSSPRSTLPPRNHHTASPTTSSPQIFSSSSAPAQGRTIYYTVADDHGGVDDSVEWPSLTYIGTSVPELTRKLKKITGLEDIILCTRNPVRDSLSPIYLQLPPNNRTISLVVVDAESTFGTSFDI
ncbi:hypothetical protein Cni_G17616 [Canna indica]|uniref:DUF569 domain-containing protein n=1 Tax=Canna indica TaxID=4628 RepID=A0AAQ3QGY8_9LILI|nr:hypothetical protein Cni_G17616 [Canna indica]